MSLIEEWSEFNVAMAGATAALAGLVIVAASVNIAEIVRSRTLTARLLAGIAALLLPLSVAALGLVPRIDDTWFGALTIIATLIAAAFQVNAAWLIGRDPSPADRRKPLKYVVGFLPIIAYLAAGRGRTVAAPVRHVPRGSRMRARSGVRRRGVVGRAGGGAAVTGTRPLARSAPRVNL